MAARDFKIVYRRSGIRYEDKYAATLAGALKIARKKGFATGDARYDGNSLTPLCAMIFMRNPLDHAIRYWVHLCTINADTITLEDDDHILPNLDRDIAKLQALRESIMKIRAEVPVTGKPK